MLKNYIKIAFRTLWRQKGYSFINIFGLAVGLACFILILLFVQHELSYDRFYEKSDHIYRIVQRQPGNLHLGTDYFAVTPALLAPTLINEYPEVRGATSIRRHGALLSQGERHFWEEGLLADAHFFDVFSFPLVHGDAKTALVEPNSIILTESLASKIFHHKNPVGQTLSYESGDTYTVTGVTPDVPENSTIQFTFIAPARSGVQYLSDIAESMWANNNWHTFFVLADGSEEDHFQAKMPTLVKKYVQDGSNDPWRNPHYVVQPMNKIHLHSGFNNDIAVTGDIKYVYLFSSIGLLILLLACVNYTNLAVARSIKRSREVGMRKVAGSTRNQLLGQFLGESMMIALLALVLALVMVDLLLPFFGHLVERPIQIDYLANGLIVPGLLVLVVLVGLFSGSYPAFFMASLRPIHVLTGRRDRRSSKFRLQRVLIVGQYAVSIALVAGSFVVYQQMEYVQDKDLGYDRDHIITILVRDQALRDNFETIRDEWLRDPRVTAVTALNDLPTNIQSNTYLYDWESRSDNDPPVLVYLPSVGYDFLDVFGVKLVAGRSFSREIASDADNAYLINETAAHALGWTPTEAVGKHLTRWEVEGTVVGVVEDFHMHSMHHAIQPMIAYAESGWFRYIAVKVRPTDLPETIASLERTVKQFTPYPFEYQFLDDRFDQLYRKERRLGEIFGFFTVLAFLIASLGLFGIAAYAAETRTKEIGVRKVLGASVAGIVTLLSKDFLKLVLTGFLIATPFAWYAMNRWLEDFAYRIEIGPGVFILPGLAAVLIALATVSWQSVRAAVANPVEALRSE